VCFGQGGGATEIFSPRKGTWVPQNGGGDQLPDFNEPVSTAASITAPRASGYPQVTKVPGGGWRVTYQSDLRTGELTSNQRQRFGLKLQKLFAMHKVPSDAKAVLIASELIGTAELEIILHLEGEKFITISLEWSSSAWRSSVCTNSSGAPTRRPDSTRVECSPG
jgi:hypothetical protein